ncbi:MAG: hypothetical protein IT447_11755 [Phycisphaerales bacterium]|jgi:hypothetical protein|nr:hypothetical protein [Phycisphaerales bacterium]
MSARNLSACLIAAMLSLGAYSVHTSGLSLDFENDDPGSPPTGTIATSGRVEVVDSPDDPDDPFATADNKSLMLEDSVMETSANAAFALNADGLESGTLTLDLYLTKDKTWNVPYLDVRLGTGRITSGSDIAVWIGFYPNGSIKDEAGGTLDNTATFNKPHKLEVQFNAKTGKWTGKLDGKELTAKGGTVKEFGFKNAVPSIQSVGFGSGYSTNETSRVFVDNVVIQPAEAAQ